KPVTMKLEGVALKSALNLLLHQVHLTYVVGDEVLKITTPDQARGRLKRIVYPVPDLIMPVRDASPVNPSVFQAARQMMGENPNLKLNSATPFLSQNSMGGTSTPVSLSQSMTGSPSVASAATPTVTKENPKGTLQEELIRLIMSAIEPTTWREMGGQ